MKKFISGSKIFAVVCALFVSSSLFAQGGNAIGVWVNDVKNEYTHDYTSGVLEIKNKTSTWNVFNNHMYLNFTNKMEGDTLLLVYNSCDCTTVYIRSNIKFPQSGKVVAKCVRLSESELSVTYTDKKFVKSVYDYARMSNSEKKKIFPPVMHIHREK